MAKRRANQLRELSFQTDFPSNAPGSILVSMGETKVICTASIEEKPPSWLLDADPPRGWVTAEYNMLPGSTMGRKHRGNDSRSTEIQRLIGRALRCAVDLEKMPGLLIAVDCDVIKADGGTRTASITGGYVALAQAINVARDRGLIKGNPIVSPIAAISVGIIDGKAYLDLDYALDSRAEVDMNVAMNGKGDFVEIQGTGEEGTFSRAQLNELLDLATKGCKQLITAQRKALKG